ncbi:MAG: hypothetical protein UT26_C0029G0005 [Microgenomates group bacterium GW2011_GWC1_39_12]|nr:MAG: hypothetical protein UT26_C0029G0005 [Microgenomates group bacterium GW2011_GWC1_39_12]
MKKIHWPKYIALIPLLCCIATISLGLYFWYVKYQLTVVRYFDHDELSYLYWARHMVDGSMPYRDFFAYSAPGFFWFLKPVVYFFHGFMAFIAGRIMMYGIFVSLAIFLSALFWEMRKSWIVVFIPLLLVFLPLPSDKFIEIRPDTLAIFLVVIGLWIQIRCMNRTFSFLSRKMSLFFVGVCFALSVVTSQKMLPIVAISFLGFVGWNRTHSSRADVVAILGGGALIGLMACIWFASLGNLSLVWYSLVTLPFEANKLAKLFPIAADFFFYPNDVIYGTGGYHIGYWLNGFLWTFGILIAIFRFVTTVTFQDTKTVWQEGIISANCLLSILLFVYVMPMKHAQYLIPSAVFIVWYVADGLYIFWKENQKIAAYRIWVVLSFGIFIYLLCIGHRLVNEPKSYWRHDQKTELEGLLRTIPTTEYILDFECVSLYYPSPYYITCMPVGQVTPLISLKLPTVRERLKETNTKYIYQGRWQRTQELLPADQEYIKEHFVPIGDGKLLVRSDIAETYAQ